MENLREEILELRRNAFVETIMGLDSEKYIIGYLGKTVPKEIFYGFDLVGMFDYLGATGFTIDADIALEDICIRVNMDYMYRIMDNLVSNIQKYADPEQYLIVAVDRKSVV